ncbi:MAG: hypothetical protein WDO73_05925 [Ignavibacteriota bacterium]
MSGVYWMESKMELRKMARLKQYSLSTVCFPLMFYVFFGLAMASSYTGSVSISKYLLATYGAFGRDGRDFVRVRRGCRGGARTRLAGSEARQSHAPCRVSGGEGCGIDSVLARWW